MIKLDLTQIQDLQSNALESFLMEMEGWAAESQGSRIATLPPGTVRKEVMRARKLGFTLRGHVKTWLSLGFELGMPFATAGLAANVANDDAIAPAVRLDILEREAVFALLKHEEEELSDAV